MAETQENIVPYTKTVKGIIIPGVNNCETVLQCLEFVPDPGDIVLVTYPKSGTNWVSQIIALLKSGGVPPRKAEEYWTLCPFLDFFGPDGLKNMAKPRCYKIHFHYKDAPKSDLAKYVVVLRNPKDCLVSLYHFMKGDVYRFKEGTFDTMFSLFMKGQVLYNDYFDQILSWYEHRHDENVLFLYYEKMKMDVNSAIIDIAKFMGPEYEELVKDSRILEDIVKYSSFDYMKCTTDDLALKSITESNELVDTGGNTGMVFQGLSKALTNSNEKPPPFVRKGIVGDWRNHFSSSQNRVFDEMIEKRLKRTEMYQFWKANDCI